MRWPFRFWNGLSLHHQSPFPSFALSHYFNFLFPCLPTLSRLPQAGRIGGVMRWPFGFWMGGA